MPSLSRLFFRAARVGGLTAIGRAVRPGATILCYHNVVDGAVPAADAALHLALSDFDAQVTYLQRRFTVVPLEELHDRATAGRSLRGLCAITFDDAYQGTLRHGVALLRARALPCTVFVPTDAPSRGEPFWWDLHAVGAAADPARRTRCIEDLAGDRASILAQARSVDGPLPAQCLPASWDEILAARSPDCVLGAHTVTHRNLVALDPAQRAAELRESAAELQRRSGERPAWLAYPYGRWDREVARAARDAGYRGAFTLEGNDVTARTDWSSAPRVNIPAGIPLDSFVAWVSGFAHWRSRRA